MDLFDNSYYLIAFFSILIIASYLFTVISNKLRIPSVILLLASGIIVRQVIDANGYELPDTQVFLEIFGIIGLILIVLEGALELKITKEKTRTIRKSFSSALFILLITTLFLALIIFLVIPGTDFRTAFINALPMAVISSAIAIPSVMNFSEKKRDFLIYESIFSYILGILIFNMVIHTTEFTWMTAAWTVIDFGIVISVSFVLTILLLFFLDKTKMNIKFFLMIAILILLFDLGKIMHLSSLLLILIFGLILNNIGQWWKQRMNKYINVENLNRGIEQFKVFTGESAFLIRTLFFFLFGFSLQISVLYDPIVILGGMIAVAVIYFVRFMYLRYVSRVGVFPEITIAPRGLITILLFFSIPQESSIGLISQGILFFVILVTSLVMMFGLFQSKAEISEIEMFDTPDISLD
ncbi:MAG: cation:proton antiporter [Bacteroidetes bacterium]|nr:cation:proton antiporter [Bacteroidota bacterium]